MYNGNEHTEITELDKLIIGSFCKEIIGERHEIDWSRYKDPNTEIDLMREREDDCDAFSNEKFQREEGL